MKTYVALIFLVSVVCISSHDSTMHDTSTINVDVYACKPSDGDCSRIISKNHLTGISCDSVKVKYPVYVVTLENVQSRTDMASAPAIFIGDTEIGEWGGNGLKIFFQIYCDSLLESFTGKTVIIYPPGYPSSQTPVQKGAFPDSTTVDSLLSAAKNGTAALPTVSDVLN